MSFQITNNTNSATGNVKVIGSANDVTNGPHTTIKLDSDNFPVFQQLNLSHDNLALNFDSYYDTDGAYKSGYFPSQFSIQKSNDQLAFNYSSNVSQGSTVSWSPALTINNAGSMALGSNGTFFNSLLSGSTTFGSSSTSTGTLRTTISIGKTMPSTNYSVLVTPEVIGNVAEVYTTSVYSKSTTSFGVNIRRMDSIGAAWTSTVVLNWTILG